jgi:Ulp1 family protease
VEDLKSVENPGPLLKFSMDIQEAIYDGDPDDVDSWENKRLYCSDNGYTVQRNSIRRLKPGTYLNNDLIGYYFGCLNAREYKQAELEGTKMKILFFDPQFFRMMSGDSIFDSYAHDVVHWVKKYKRKYNVDIFDVDKIVFAINHPTMQHHFGVLVDNQVKVIYFLDSLYAATRSFRYIVLGKMLDFLGYMHHKLQVGGRVVYRSDPDQDRQTTFPQQGNGDDCGVFLCMGGDCLGLGIGYEFNQSIMERCRG